MEYFWVLECSGATNPFELILPDGRSEFLVNYYHSENLHTHARAHFAGLIKKHVSLRTPATFGLLGAHLTPQGGYYLLKDNMDQTTDKVFYLENWQTKSIAELEDKISSSKDIESRVAALSEYFEDLIHNCSVDKLIDKILWKISKTKGFCTVNDLSHIFNISERQIERRFKPIVGIPGRAPKIPHLWAPENPPPLLKI